MLYMFNRCSNTFIVAICPPSSWSCAYIYIQPYCVLGAHYVYGRAITLVYSTQEMSVNSIQTLMFQLHSCFQETKLLTNKQVSKLV